MLELYHIDIAKVDQGMLHMLHLFHMNVVKVDQGICCNCFRGMLQAYVSSVSEVCFIYVFRMHVARVFI
jgi:hypothetical protein